ncbi:MAG: hypothetical protein ABIR18_06270 [Chitinophagaceae bacterium]
MKRMLVLLLAAISLGFFQSCEKDTLPIPPSSDVRLRIFNSTPWKFTECVVDHPGVSANLPDPAPYDYGQVTINAKTNYKSFPGIYHYAFIRVVMNGKTYLLQPFDYVGENPLPNGRYAYKLTYVAANDRLNLEFIQE